MAFPPPDESFAHLNFNFQAVTFTGSNITSATHLEGRGGHFDKTIQGYSRRLIRKVKKQCEDSIAKVFAAYQRNSRVNYKLLICPHFSSPSSASSTGELLIKEAEKSHARMIIIGSHGPIGGMAHIGSISRHVWHHSSTIPVLLIPPRPPPREAGKEIIVSQLDVILILEDEDQLRECSQFVAECLVRSGDSIHVWFVGSADKQPVPQSISLDIESSLIAQSSCEGVYSRGFSSSSSISASTLRSPLGLFAIYENGGIDTDEINIEDSEIEEGSDEEEEEELTTTLPETINQILEFYSSIRLVAVFDTCGGGVGRSLKCEVTRGEMVRYLTKNCPKPLVLIPPTVPTPPLNEGRDDIEVLPSASSSSEDAEEGSELENSTF